MLGPTYLPFGYSQVSTPLSLIMSKYLTIQVNSVATLLNLSLETINKVLIICLGFAIRSYTILIICFGLNGCGWDAKKLSFVWMPRKCCKRKKEKKPKILSGGYIKPHTFKWYIWNPRLSYPNKLHSHIWNIYLWMFGI